MRLLLGRGKKCHSKRKMQWLSLPLQYRQCPLPTSCCRVKIRALIAPHLTSPLSLGIRAGSSCSFSLSKHPVISAPTATHITSISAAYRMDVASFLIGRRSPKMIPSTENAEDNNLRFLLMAAMMDANGQMGDD